MPEQTPKPLELGIAFHKGMEAVYDPELWDVTSDQQKLDAAIKVFTDTCHQQQQRFLEVTRQVGKEQAFGDDYQERIDLGIGMLTHYMKNIHPQADQWFKPVAVEVPFSVPLTYPEDIQLRFSDDVAGFQAGDIIQCTNSPRCGQVHDNPANVTLNGRVDAILEDTVNGGYYIADWKSAATLITDGEFLQLDDQITSYCAALQLILNIDVRGFLYAEFKKAFPQPPKPLKRLQAGKKFSTAKNQDTDLDMALMTFQNEDHSAYMAGFYDDYLNMLREDPPKYHQRFPVIQSDAKLKNVLSNVAMEAMDMTDPDLRLYPAPSKMNCSGCAFKAPCLGKFNDEQYLYTLESLYGRKT